MALLAHLYSHIRGSQEDIATLSLQYIISQSLELNCAFTKLLGKVLDEDLPEHLNYTPQSAGDNKERPDLSGVNEFGKEVVLCEAKFYAGLTENQPNAYLDRLQRNSGKGLVFICPTARRVALWTKLQELCKERNVEQVADYCSFVDETKLALVTWNEVLDTLRQTAAAVEVQSLADIEQLDGFCKQMDSEAFIPFSPEEFGPETARKEERYYRVVEALIDAFKADKSLVTSTKNVRKNGNRDGFISSIFINGVSVTIAYDRKIWMNPQTAETPFWMTVYESNEVQLEGFKKALTKYPERNKYYGYKVWLALTPLPNKSLDELVGDLKHQVLAYLNDLNEKRISINDNKEYDRIYEIINDLLGKKLQGWQSATYQIDESRVFWFPQLAVSESGELKAQSKTKDWVNILSLDGETIHAYSENNASRQRHWHMVYVTFAREKGHGYKYVGTFRVDQSCSTANDITYKRVETEERF